MEGDLPLTPVLRTFTGWTTAPLFPRLLAPMAPSTCGGARAASLCLATNSCAAAGLRTKSAMPLAPSSSRRSPAHATTIL